MRYFFSAMTLVVCILAASSVDGDIVEFYLTGAAGDGLLPGNISPPTSSTGSGGLGLTGITFDTDTNILSVDIEWGSENGYSDLTGEVTLLHLHGPTASLPPDNFGEVDPNVIVNLAGSLNFNPSGTGGSLNDFFLLSAQDAEYLLSGRTYINVHTAMYDTGEIRGYVLQVPEPGAGLGIVCCLALFAARRRR